MTTPPTDAELRAALELAAKATAGPWRNGLGDGSGAAQHSMGAWIDNPDEESTVIVGGHDDWGVPVGVISNDDAEFIAASRSNWPAAAEALLAARAALREVHRRVVTDHYTGTSKDSPRYWSCRLCSWTWKCGEAALHEPSCPLADRAVLGEA